MNFDEDYDEELEDEFDEELEDQIEEYFEESDSVSIEDVDSKTPNLSEGKKISVYFLSTIGPGEKKQKLIIFTGNIVGDIKDTAANLYGLDPLDFHLSSGGVTLDENSTLSDYNVEDGDDILLIPASTAGND
jgi:hypothetical protein